MNSRIRIKDLPSCNPDPSTAKAHHVGSPPTAFVNPWPSYQPIGGLLELFKIRFGDNPEKNPVPVPEGPNGTRSPELVNIRTPDWGVQRPNKLRATWIGHASFFVETPALPAASADDDDDNDDDNNINNNNRGIRILFDPVFSERTSPVTWFGPKRYTPPPCPLAAVPPIDLICISHNHYDHLDLATLRTLRRLAHRRRADLQFCVGLGMKAWFLANLSCAPHEVSEFDWWDVREFTIFPDGEEDGDDGNDDADDDDDQKPRRRAPISLRLTCCPAQHGSRRTPFDEGKALWCSWAVTTTTPTTTTNSTPTAEKSFDSDPASAARHPEGGGKSLYFAGDTAYQAYAAPTPCPVFAQIGHVLGPFDLALVPIGLYSPPRTAGGVHATPEQAFEITKAVGAKLGVGMHYGTVRGGLSAVYEDVREPARRWRRVAETAGRWCGGGVEGDGDAIAVDRVGVGLCDVGETVAV